MRSLIGLRMIYHSKTQAAFSLLELLAVVAILGIIAALIVPRVTSGTDTAKVKTCVHNRTEINITVEQYHVQTGNWPANDLSDIAADPNYFPERVHTCPVTGMPYRLDPASHRVIGHGGASDHTP